jgi:AmmeMemoRadiSam system protein A
MEHIILYNATEREILLQTAHAAINYGLEHQTNLVLDLTKYPAILLANRACFVTLHLANNLCGCIGSLQAHQPLIIDVAHNAFNAAFHDPRFAPLSKAKALQIKLDISVLSTPEPMQFDSEANLLAQLRPQIDGLILSDAGHRGTFLPTVWQQFPDPLIFFSHLKNKAGLPANYWSSTLKVQRYTTELIS